MGAWEEMSEQERKVNVIIDTMNTMRFLCGITDNNSGEYYADLKSNKIMVYDTEQCWSLAEELQRVPEIYFDESVTTGLNWVMQFWYRGVRLYTFMYDEEAKKYQESMKKMCEELIFDDSEKGGDGDADDE